MHKEDCSRQMVQHKENISKWVCARRGKTENGRWTTENGRRTTHTSTNKQTNEALKELSVPNVSVIGWFVFSVCPPPPPTHTHTPSLSVPLGLCVFSVSLPLYRSFKTVRWDGLLERVVCWCWTGLLWRTAQRWCGRPFFLSSSMLLMTSHRWALCCTGMVALLAVHCSIHLGCWDAILKVQGSLRNCLFFSMYAWVLAEISVGILFYFAIIRRGRI